MRERFPHRVRLSGRDSDASLGHVRGGAAGGDIGHVAEHLAGAPALIPSVEATRPARGAWTVWGLGVLAYVVAVFSRGSLAVAGLEAQHRFGATASALALFSVLQLAVYAAMQVPVGVLLDRFGSRRMLVTGAVLIGIGQLVLGYATSVPGALAARVLVGAGDAMTFISVLRLVPLWFPARRVPLVTQLTGILGQLGQVVATYPLVALLRNAGWTASFTGAGVASALVAGLLLLAVRDAPPGTALSPPAPSLAAARRILSAAWREPGTRIGLWTHFTTQFSGTAFALLWGFPFLVVGEGLSPSTAGALLSAMVVVTMLVGPVLGSLVGGWPLRRSVLTLSIVLGSAATWTLVLLWPGRAPLPVLALLVVVLATNGPGSMIGFDYARTFNPASRVGSASGIVNVGGFVASLVTILLVGAVLDVRTPGGSTAYTLGSFKLAFTLQYALWAVGLVLVLRERRVLRRRLAVEGIRIDPVHRAVQRRLRALAAARAE